MRRYGWLASANSWISLEERQGQAAERQSMTDRQMSFIRQMAREKGVSEEGIDDAGDRAVRQALRSARSA